MSNSPEAQSNPAAPPSEPATSQPHAQRAASPTALNAFLGCEYRTYLDLLEARGEPVAERKPVNFQLLMDRGNRHEDDIVAAWVREGRDVAQLEPADGARKTRVERAAETVDAMRAGREIIHQGCFFHGGRVGYPDFLMRVDGTESDFGGWSYEVADAKLSRKPSPANIFQLLFYDDELTRLQGTRAARMRLYLGDGSQPEFTASDFTAYAERIYAEFTHRREQLSTPEPAPQVAYPYPCSSCDFCDWWQHCTQRRRDDDHLSLVAGLSRDQGLKLEAHGVRDIAALAALPDNEIVTRLTGDTTARLRAQADLQLRSRGVAQPRYELLKPEPDTGLARLPKPSPGDVHFDFEGDPNWGDDGLEYLFGTVYDDATGNPVYIPRWATSRAEEKAAFEDWIDWITTRLEQWPELHVFHYNAYEVTAIKRLMVRHATRQHEVDELLRRKVFVDLYGITRQAIRAGVESYGLKGMEPVFGYERDAELRGAIGSLRRWQAFQDDGDRAHLDGIALYNEDDCLSTRALYPWLLARVPEAEAQYGLEIAALKPEPPKPLSKAQQTHVDRLEELREPLTANLPDDESQDTPEQRAYRVAFDLLSYHVSERKPAQWSIFDRRTRSASQLRHEDGDGIGELTVLSGPEAVAKSWQWRLSYPEQQHKLGPGKVDDIDREKSGVIVELDEEARTLVYKRATSSGDEPPTRLGPDWPLMHDAQQRALYEFGQRIAASGVEPTGTLDAGTDLLMRRAPRLRPCTPPLADEPFDLGRLRQQVRGLDRSALVIQGPPGTGKTWTGARIAVDLLARGLKVGVMANSHKAINNLLEAIDEAADEANAEHDPEVIAARSWAHADFRGWKKGTDEDDRYDSARVVYAKDHPGDDLDTGRAVTLIGGTAWHWASTSATDSVDVLLIDEAGQVSLADAIAVSQGAKSVVLLGDPQQLAHVSQGTHPHGSGASVLEHLLGDRQTVPRDRGIFLGTSWRMHPAICDFVGKAMYDDSLDAVAGNAIQRIDSPAGLRGSGLRMLPCDHAENRGRSPEEADLIAAEVAKLLHGGTYVLREGDGQPRPITLNDILVVAPYNAQVRCLRSKLPDGARVGTVDKFQGQEAPIVFFSMTASSGDDVSRGLSFLFSRNRLNVAVSRAQALAVVVCSPRLLSARCSTVDDMRLVNMLCQFADAAEVAPTA